MNSEVQNEKVTYDEVMQLIKAVTKSQRELTESQKETELMFKETAVKFKETDELLSTKFKETDKQIKELGKQIGGLGNKFGTFNEGLVLPSLRKLFHHKFNCTDISERYKFYSNGDSMEIDLLAISKTSCFIIEIKSHYRQDAFEQLLNQIERFRRVKLEHSDKKIYGVLVATHYEKENINELLRNGIYFISISNDLVELQIPDSFEPRAW